MIGKKSLAFKISIIVMLVSFFGVVTLAYLSYQDAKEIFIENSADMLFKDLQEYENHIHNKIESLKNNIVILSSNPLILGFLRAYNNKYKYDEKNNKTFLQYQKDVINTLKLIMIQNVGFFQIRILDINGQEIIKLIKKNNKVDMIPQERLQNKSHRDYYRQMICNDNIFISKIDLNKEFRNIEFPIIPTIRVGKIIEENKNQLGMIIINVDVSKIFNFPKLRKSKTIKTFLANQEGYYIFNENEPQKEFGFEFGRDYKIVYDYPFIKQLYLSDKRYIKHFKNNKIYIAKKIFLDNGRFLIILKSIGTESFNKRSDKYIKKVLLYIFTITIIITIVTIILVLWFTKPIKELTEIAKEITKTKGNKRYKIDIKTGDEIEELAKAIQIMLNSLIDSKKELESFTIKLEEEVKKKTKELRELNKNLQKIVEEKVKEIREKDKALLQQSKLAIMGEMIGAIAHQWRQPLNALALNIQLLEDKAENGELTQEEIEKFVEKSMETINFMSKTIDDFRNFFKKDKEQTIFNLKEAIEKTIDLQKAQLENRGIKIVTNLDEVKIKGFKNEFMQVILNLISNARDAIEERRKKDPKLNGVIEIKLTKKKDLVQIIVRDNGGGIDKNIIDRIFEPYFTTKEDDKGTGIGLYMSKNIIERIGGKIKVKNSKNGAEFIIELRTENEN